MRSIPYYSKMNYFEGRGHDLFGYLQGIKTRNTSTKERVKDDERIVYMVLWMMLVGGAHLNLKLIEWQNPIFRICLPRQIQQTWNKYWIWWTRW